MSVRSGQSITTEFTTRAFATGAATDATGTPTGTLYLNGTANGATVTVTNQATGVYKAAVTLPTLAVGDVVSILINATVSGVTDNAKVWEDSKDVFAGAIPDVAAGGSGGLFISGSNSGTTTLGALTVSGTTTLAALAGTTATFSGAVAFQSTFAITGNVSMAAGLNITQSSSNTSALVVTGNGTGHGAAFTSGSGATGDAIRATAASTNGNGAQFLGTGTQSGFIATGGATGTGVSAVGGATSGDGFSASGGTSGHGIKATGSGSNDGIHTTGGTNSYGIRSEGTGTGSGILATSGSGATGDGIVAQALSTNGSGMSLISTGTGSGLLTDKVTASGAVAFSSTFAVAGTVTYNAFTVTNTFTVSGATTLTGAVTASNASNNIVGISIATGGIAEASFATTAGSFAPLGIIDQGTAQSATGTTVVLRAAAAFADDTLIGATIAVLGSTQGYWQERIITDNVLSTDTVTVDTWTVTPSGTLTYKIFATPPALAAVPDVNVQYVNNIEVDGAGTTGDPWGPV